MDKPNMDFDKILLKAPKLISMMYEAQQVGHCSGNVRNQYWYKILKPKVIELVGFNAEDPELNSTEIYDKTYSFFIDLMEL